MTGDYGTFGVRSDGYGVTLYQPVADQPTRSAYPWIANLPDCEVADGSPFDFPCFPPHPG